MDLFQHLNRLCLYHEALDEGLRRMDKEEPFRAVGMGSCLGEKALRNTSYLVSGFLGKSSRFENGGIGGPGKPRRTVVNRSDLRIPRRLRYRSHRGSLGDRIGRALRHTRAASNALVSNLHCHGFYSLIKFVEIFA